MVYHITLYECSYWDNVKWPWPGSIPHRSRPQGTIKGQSIHPRVRAISYLCTDGIPYNLVLMFSYLRRAVTLTRVHTSKVKVMQYIYRSEYKCLYPRDNLLMHWRFSGDIAVLWTALCGYSSLPALYHVDIVYQFVPMIMFSHNRVFFLVIKQPFSCVRSAPIIICYLVRLFLLSLLPRHNPHVSRSDRQYLLLYF